MNRFLYVLLFGIALIFSLAGAIVSPFSVSLAQTPPALSQLTASQPTTIDFSVLRSQLQGQNWQAADAETRRILQTWLLPGGDLFSTPAASNIPPDVLQTLDRLWTTASNGRFGYSPQQLIWNVVKSQFPDPNDAVLAFGDRVGWRRSTPDSENFVSPNWLTEPELNNSLDAPIGHLPWAGVAWARIEAMLAVQSCGSCMIDAMDLQGERFNRYLPVLFDWLTIALNPPSSQPSSRSEPWQQARLARAIEKTTQISNPSRSCPLEQQKNQL